MILPDCTPGGLVTADLHMCSMSAHKHDIWKYIFIKSSCFCFTHNKSDILGQQHKLFSLQKFWLVGLPPGKNLVAANNGVFSVRARHQDPETEPSVQPVMEVRHFTWIKRLWKYSLTRNSPALKMLLKQKYSSEGKWECKEKTLSAEMAAVTVILLQSSSLNYISWIQVKSGFFCCSLLKWKFGLQKIVRN